MVGAPTISPLEGAGSAGTSIPPSDAPIVSRPRKAFISRPRLVSAIPSISCGPAESWLKVQPRD